MAEKKYKVVRHSLSGIKKVLLETNEKKEAYDFLKECKESNNPGKYFVEVK